MTNNFNNMSLKLFVFFMLLNHFTCSKYCPKSDLTAKISSRAACYYRNAQVPCNDRIVPGTQALVSCATGFIAPPVQRGLIRHLRCGANGNWDHHPYSCKMQCGRVAARTQEFSLGGGNMVNITAVPWHVGIYYNKNGAGYTHICGGTIITPNLVISAAHCFWDNVNEEIYSASLLSVVAGKNFREYDSTDEVFQVQKRNISKIHISRNFMGRSNNYKDDIAVVELTSHFKFSEPILPVCIEFLEQSQKEVLNDWTGNFAGWSKINEYWTSDVLQPASIQTLYYHGCDRRLRRENPSYHLSSDKFCLIDEYGGSRACRGDGGSGFVIPFKDSQGREYNRLAGIISHGATKGDCAQSGLIVVTNIQWFEWFIGPLKAESENNF